MKKDKIKNFINNKRCTLLGVGPMSINCVDASIEISALHDIPILLIASRRQIDSDEFGGGYVNNWTTREFAEYVINKDKKGNIIISRDHGGPWQNNKEIDQNYSFKKAMDSAKSSFLEDINSGFEIIADTHSEFSNVNILFSYLQFFRKN